MFGFHFGTQPSITQEHLPSPTGRMISPKWLLWVTLGDPGCKNRRIENPRVGGSIPPLATIESIAGVVRGPDDSKPQHAPGAGCRATSARSQV